MSTSLTQEPVVVRATEDEMSMALAQQRIQAIRRDAINRMHHGENPSIQEVIVGTMPVEITQRRWLKKRTRRIVTAAVLQWQIAQPLLMGSGQHHTGLSVSLQDSVLLKRDGEPHYRTLDLKVTQQQFPSEFTEICTVLTSICYHRHLMEFQHG